MGLPQVFAEGLSLTVQQARSELEAGAKHDISIVEALLADYISRAF